MNAPRPIESSRTGSALLLTLMELSLMLVVDMAFTAHVRLQLRGTSTRQLNQQAEANARLAMELALARLQRQDSGGR